MAKPTVTWLYNSTDGDGANTGGATGGAGENSSNWVAIDLANDRIMFLDTQQNDGDLRTGSKFPVIIPQSGSIEAPKTFVDNYDAGVFDQVKLAGTSQGQQSGGDKRYVFAIYFSGATAGPPYLEAWDDSSHSTIANAFLGSGTASNSTLRAVATTNAAPGLAAWEGTPLAGLGSRVQLDTAALNDAKCLYFNIKQVIPFDFLPQQNNSIVLTLRYLYS